MAKKYKSIVSKDLTICWLCGAPATDMHHIFNGANKKKSEKYGLMMPLCMNCHTGDNGVHTIPGRMNEVKAYGQTMFELYYPEENFRAIFGKNYKED